MLSCVIARVFSFCCDRACILHYGTWQWWFLAQIQQQQRAWTLGQDNALSAKSDTQPVGVPDT